MEIAIIDYGAGNVFSVQSAFERLGVRTALTADADKLLSADGVIFPGVGHATTAMQQLKAKNLHLLIPEMKKPVFGICLGMQLLCEKTEEGMVEGLGVFDNVVVEQFAFAPKIPHIGWNNLTESSGSLSEISGDVYFVHSFYAPVNTYTVAKCFYGETFSAALEKDNFLACQFHPEKSGVLGEDILKRFLNKI
jgi:imidazole glycerol-phosphate synthase subunit HisH